MNLKNQNNTMKYAHKKVTTPELIIEELSIETEGKKSYSLIITTSITIILVFSISLYVHLNISGKMEFDYLFTNRPRIEQQINPRKSLK